MENNNIDWTMINSKLNLLVELRKCNLISPEVFEIHMERMAEEAGIKTRRAIEREYESIYTEMALKAAEC